MTKRSIAYLLAGAMAFPEGNIINIEMKNMKINYGSKSGEESID